MQRPDNERGTDKERLTILIYRYTEYKVHTHTHNRATIAGHSFRFLRRGSGHCPSTIPFGGAQDFQPRTDGSGLEISIGNQYNNLTINDMDNALVRDAIHFMPHYVQNELSAMNSCFSLYL